MNTVFGSPGWPKLPKTLLLKSSAGRGFPFERRDEPAFPMPSPQRCTCAWSANCGVERRSCRDVPDLELYDPLAFAPPKARYADRATIHGFDLDHVSRETFRVQIRPSGYRSAPPDVRRRISREGPRTSRGPSISGPGSQPAEKTTRVDHALSAIAFRSGLALMASTRKCDASCLL